MNIKERLLFLFIPLTFLPLVLVVVSVVFLSEQASTSRPLALYTPLLITFIVLVVIVAIALLVNIAHAIATPLQQLTEEARRIAAGDLTARMATISDTAELGQLTSAIQTMRENIVHQQTIIREESAHAATGKLAAHVAHDLASPLFSLQTVVDEMKYSQSEARHNADVLHVMELAIKRLKGIAQELLDQRKGIEPQPEFFSLHRVLDELLSEMSSQERYRALQVVKRYHLYDINIFGLQTKIQRMFGNLIKNAIEAMDAVGTLTVTTQLFDKTVQVDIHDTGCGIPPEILEKVLEGGRSYGKADGNGIGTEVIRNVLTEHGGSLSATSEVGIGTMFRAKLPLLSEKQH